VIDGNRKIKIININMNKNKNKNYRVKSILDVWETVEFFLNDEKINKKIGRFFFFSKAFKTCVFLTFVMKRKMNWAAKTKSNSSRKIVTANKVSVTAYQARSNTFSTSLSCKEPKKITLSNDARTRAPEKATFASVKAQTWRKKFSVRKAAKV
jgi:hypothetical protein